MSNTNQAAKLRRLLSFSPKAITFTFLSFMSSFTWAVDAQSLEQQYSSEAKQATSAIRGEKFFTSKHGKDWSCATCHNAPPTNDGKHASTDKTIAPLAPSFNAKRFTDEAKVNKWFKRNCNDVLSRECSPLEKADTLAYLNTFKR
jgi:cytochrome c peroxidase